MLALVGVLFRCVAITVSSSSGRIWNLSTAVHSWTALENNIPSNGSATIVLDAATFNCDDYDSRIGIWIPGGTVVTINGNGATLDAARKGRFFYVSSGGALALDHLVLRNGVATYVSNKKTSGPGIQLLH